MIEELIFINGFELEDMDISASETGFNTTNGGEQGIVLPVSI